MQKSISIKIVIGGFCLALLIFIGVSVISYSHLTQLMELPRSMDYSYKLQEHLKDLLSQLNSANAIAQQQQSLLRQIQAKEQQVLQEQLATVVTQIQRTHLIMILGHSSSLAILMVLCGLLLKQHPRFQPELSGGSQQSQTSRTQMAQREQLILSSAQRIRQTLDLDTILETTVTEVREFLGVDRVLVYRIWSDGTGSTVAESVTPDTPPILGQTFPAEVFPEQMHQLYCQGRIRTVVNPETDGVAPCLVEFLQHLGVKSKLVVPILQQEKLWGLMIAHHCSQPRQWQPLEIDLLSQLAIQVTIAIHQAQLYQQLQNELSERERIEAQLRQARDELEIRVQERTGELIHMNADLQTQIHERMEAEAALKISEERFRVALHDSPITVFNQDTNLRYTWVYNPASRINTDVLIGKSELEMFSPENAQKLIPVKHRVLTTGVGERQEISIIVDGKVRYYDLTVEPLRNDAEEVVGITCAATNITDIRIREQQLRSIFEGALDAITIADDQGRYIEANPAACQLFGLPVNELLGKRIAEFMEPGFDFEAAWCLFQQQQRFTGEVRILKPNGTMRDVEYTAKANFLPGQHLSIWRDITERKRAEKALRESERFIQRIAHAMPTALYLYDLIEKRNIYSNPQITQLIGYSPEEIQQMAPTFPQNLIHPDDQAKCTTAIKRFATAKEGEIIETDYRIQHKSGEWRWLYSREMVFTRTADGLPQQILGTAQDITEHKQAESIRLALAQEQELRQLQLNFFSMASHEFRTPLSTILASVQLLKYYYPEGTDKKICRNINRIETTAKTMTQLLGDILTISRAETGKLEFTPQPIELESFCRCLVEEMQVNAGENYSINFITQHQPPIVLLDEKFLRSILINLLSNAIKYSPIGSQIDLILTYSQSTATFQIKDQGIGIPSADQKKLFTIFHRGTNIGNIPGTGLGLAVVKKCLEIQGGTISVNSEVGVGTTMTITIPLPSA
ncbi:PAS domain S-box protein [Coleofasciculus sp. G2-EDA-02]|uniref:PAS domain S-box protein n=1 Tax=Coleofasciculus sp. G2-EDA-02 TaxID=3069529 RepID=UPI0032F421C0